MIPFFRPSIGDDEVAAVTEVLRSGWLTTGEQAKAFEEAFARYTGGRYAVALNSCTAALHLALEAIGLKRGDAVLVPTFTFAATAEVVRYFDAIPLLVDCEPATLCMDLRAAQRVLDSTGHRVKAIIPMYYAGMPMDIEAVGHLADHHGLDVIEDAAHALPAAYRDSWGTWHRIGGGTARATCFSFYANKTITTGEGGMLVTDDPSLAERARVMSLHGVSKDAWKRFRADGSWQYDIVAPGFKYNMTDIAAALGLCQLKRCDQLAKARRGRVEYYQQALEDVEQLELPSESRGRHSSWHLYVVRLHLDSLKIDRAAFVEELKRRGVMSSVAWKPLHLHPYYQETYGFKPEDFPVATCEWMRIVSLPLFPDMTEEEQATVVKVVRDVCQEHRR